MTATPLVRALVLLSLCVAPLPAQDAPGGLSGQFALTAGPDGEVRGEHTFRVLRGQRITVTVASDSFDTVLELYGPGDVSLWNDDHGGTTDSRLATLATADGQWTAVVTSFGTHGGPYRLSVVLGDVGTIRLLAQETLTEDDSTSAKGERYRVHDWFVERSGRTTVRMTSPDFAPLLVVVGPDGRRYDRFDVLDEEGTAVVEVPRTMPGRWRVYASNGWDSVLGRYAVEIQEEPATGEVDIRQGTLTREHPRQLMGEHFEQYVVEGDGDALTVEMHSTAFDAYLAIRSPAGEWFRNDDGDEANGDAVLVLPPLVGRWTIFATTYEPGATGDYELIITRPGMNRR